MPSYSQVFSAPFIQYTNSTPNMSFEVPSGFTAVVRQISVNQEIGGYTAQVSIQDSGTATPLYIWQVGSIGEFQQESTEGRWVVPEGGVIVIHLSSIGSFPSFYVGGYLLRNNLT